MNEVEEYINHTDIIFNGRWKTFIIEAEPLFELNTYRAFTDCLATDNIHYYETIQATMRDYLKENNSKYDMTTETKTLGMPEYYTFGICIFLGISDCNNFLDLNKKFKQHQQDKEFIITLIGSGKHDIETEYEFDSTTTSCVCSHTMMSQSAFLLTILRTMKTLMLGCDCIYKTGIITKKQKGDLVKKKTTLRKEQKNRINNSKLDIKSKTNILKKSKLAKNKKSIIQLEKLNQLENENQRKKDLLIKWKGLGIKAVKHNNKIFWKNISLKLPKKSNCLIPVEYYI